MLTVNISSFFNTKSLRKSGALRLEEFSPRKRHEAPTSRGHIQQVLRQQMLLRVISGSFRIESILEISFASAYGDVLMDVDAACCIFVSCAPCIK